MLESDVQLWDGIVRGIEMIQPVPGMTAEIGCCKGGATAKIITELSDYGVPRDHICIDPYGGLPLKVGDATYTFDYTNEMRNQFVIDLFEFVKDKPLVNPHFFNMTDCQFFVRFEDGVPSYSGGRSYLINEYAFAFIDGPHSTVEVRAAYDFFNNRMPLGAVLVFDNVTDYDHGHIESEMKRSKWREFSHEKYRKGYVKSV